MATDPTPTTQRRQAPVWVWFALAVGLVVTVVLVVQSNRYPKRFGVAVPGQIYRSGEVRPGHLEQLQKEYGVRAILSLLNPEAPESQAEMKAAEELGLVFLNVPLRGNGASNAEQRMQIKEYLFDPSNRPLLVHCSAGANRTGLTIGMYRIYEDRWSYDQVVKEMLQYDFENGENHQNLRDALQAEAALARQGLGRP